MKIYLAARYSRHPEMREVRAILEAHGFTITSRWIDTGDDGTPEFNSNYLNSEPWFCAEYSRADVDDLTAADYVVSYTGNGGGGRGGRHVEFGLAMGLRKRLVIVGPRENIFHCLPEVLVVEDTAGLLDLLADIRDSENALNRACVNCGHNLEDHRSGGLCDLCIPVGDSTGASSYCQRFEVKA